MMISAKVTANTISMRLSPPPPALSVVDCDIQPKFKFRSAIEVRQQRPVGADRF